MNSCEKHTNHHCVHSHNCQNQEHANLKRTCRKHHLCDFVPSRHSPSQSSCNFKQPFSKENKQGQSEGLLKRQMMISELSKKLARLQKGQESNEQKIRHLEAQVEYYRTAYNEKINLSAQDMKQELKKRLNDEKIWSLRIKSLECEVLSRQKQIDSLRERLSEISVKQAKSSNRQLQKEEAVSKVLECFKKQNNTLRQSNEESLSELQELKNLKEHFQRYKDQTRKQKQEASKSIQNYTTKLQSLQLELTLLKQTHAQDKRQAENQIKSLEAQVNAHFTKQQQMDQQVARLTKENREQAQKYILLNAQYESAKSIIASSPDKVHLAVEVQANPEYSRLQAQNSALKEKISELEGSTRVTEEVFLTIGASEAFKKIVEEKNQLIKRLMREKGQLYARIG